MLSNLGTERQEFTEERRVKKGGVTTGCSPEVRRSPRAQPSMSGARSDFAFAARTFFLSRTPVGIVESEVCYEKSVI